MGIATDAKLDQVPPERGRGARTERKGGGNRLVEDDRPNNHVLSAGPADWFYRL